MPHSLRHTAILATLILFPGTAAFAGWMDQAGSMLEQMGAKQTAAPAAASALSNSDVVAGLKDALRVGSERVVAQLGKTDGFNSDPKIHIPLPESMQQVKSALSAVGMGAMMDDLELKLNRAAEAATPKAKRLFGDAIRSMSFADARAILNGPDDAATQYFKNKMSKPLADEMRPIVEKAMSRTGAVQAYDSVMGEYKTLPFMPDVKANLTQHVVDGGLKGIFIYMASEEAAIRHHPVERTTAILKKVFASQ
ncbi:DUF4197 domain-containing protein [Mariprofundus ferrooxydans]|uniref:DUF4197 domain-containing protein n=1 Tax=Mariprofundus ferrooxydans PV-1 TaxID=314345 RepID=Q0EXA9_9PROT|nr:DUF4197 domain-containing protein [Mariprofundus ferrooxydans]EAU53881.1 hypothetical protein SPV1_08086 [Mariprofundus ferrooxydans PV-1]KON48297.1 hypothetical protein AL013_02890 [Mariprofundus ferrooxydans]